MGNFRLDMVYLTPALLCLLALFAGIVPSVFCLSSGVFAVISIGIFIFSLLAHIYILVLWKRYKDSSPLAYALTQPAAHLIILAFALAVGSTSMCSQESRHAESTTISDNPRITVDSRLGEVIANEQE